MTKRGTERGLGLLFCALAAWAAYLAKDFPAQGEVFPLFASGMIAVASVLMLLHTLLAPEHYEGEARFSLPIIRPLVLTLVTITYVWSMFVIGFYVASLLYFVWTAYFIGVRPYRTIVLAASVLFPLVYALLEWLLQADMPRAVLF